VAATERDYHYYYYYSLSIVINCRKEKGVDAAACRLPVPCCKQQVAGCMLPLFIDIAKQDLCLAGRETPPLSR